MKYILNGVDQVKSVKRVFNKDREIAYVEVVCSPYHDPCMSYLDTTFLLYPTSKPTIFMSSNKQVKIQIEE